LLKHPTLDQLHALGLYGMAKAFVELSQSEEAKDLDRNDWLALLLDQEASLRRDKRLRGSNKATSRTSKASGRACLNTRLIGGRVTASILGATARCW